jgi:hypothetical protein
MTAAQAMFDRHVKNEKKSDTMKAMLNSLWNSKERAKAIQHAANTMQGDYEFWFQSDLDLMEEEIYPVLPPELAEMHSRGRIFIWRRKETNDYSIKLRYQNRKKQILRDLKEEHEQEEKKNKKKRKVAEDDDEVTEVKKEDVKVKTEVKREKK